ncbi:hypothetical protein [Abyssibius alkaniclasticus]|uniref:hypothetical protein n=1 Tax=Abyssibius alkaniclasticus TaxID=2881234 RepID=UPI0040599D95|tara:strand:- start:441 stop:824 length:384 start_codon:yes stop_codon:yes gene_type:complete
MTPAALRKLGALAQQVERRDLAALRLAQERVAALNAAQATLDSTQAALYADDSMIIGAAYGDWLRLEAARIAKALQKAERAVLAARGNAARAFARKQALSGLQEQAEAEELQTARRRAEQNGMPADR